MNPFKVIIDIARLKFLRKSNKPIRPKLIAYNVTWRCNAKCPMCGVHKLTEEQKQVAYELSANDIREIFKDPALHGLDLIRFTGGEPFLKEDFLQIVDEIVKNAAPKFIYVTTNATYPKKIEEFVEYFGKKKVNFTIQLSIDAVGEEHDRIRGIPGSHKSVRATMEILRELRKKYKFNVGINQVVLSEDFACVEELNKLAKEFGFSHRMWLAEETHESDIMHSVSGTPYDAASKTNYSLELKFKKEVLEKLYSEVRNIIKNKISITDFVNYSWAYLHNYLIEGARNRVIDNNPYPNPPCQALFCYARIMPNGDILSCTLKPQVIGNLKKEKFSDIWFSQKADTARGEVKKCKGCWVECDIVPNALYSGDFIKYYIRKQLGIKS